MNINSPPDGMPVDLPPDPPPPYNQGPTSHGWGMNHMGGPPHSRDRPMHPGMVRGPSRMPMDGHHRMPGHLRFPPGTRMPTRMPMYPGSGPQPGYMGPVMTRGAVPRMPQPNEPFPFSKKLTEKASMYVSREGHLGGPAGMAPGMFEGEPGMVPRMSSPEWPNQYPGSMGHVRLSQMSENISPPHGPGPMGMSGPGPMHGQPRMDGPDGAMDHGMRMPNPNMHNPSYNALHSKMGPGQGGPGSYGGPDGGPEMNSMPVGMDARGMSGPLTPQEANNAMMMENMRRAGGDPNRPPDMKMNTVMPKSPMTNFQGGEELS